MSKVRVRFAPSPTGFFHIGSARTALFNWLYARHTNGTFILRIEDTDEARNTLESLHALMDGMSWLNLDWDEGPKFEKDGSIKEYGDYGAYFQSKRSNVYLEYLEILRKNGRAYDKDGAVFFKVSGQTQVLNDAVYGDVARMEEKDFPIFRSNGTPVFHFVNVVDDIAMQITNVIRGQDHLTNTNKHIELFKAFDAPMPQFAHIPLILKSEGEGKMSKRDKGALIEEYRDKNFLPEAVRNYLCLLGWNPKNGKEIMPIDEIVGLFDFSGIIRSNARFDEKKMAHFNTEHIRALPAEGFAKLAFSALSKDKNIANSSEDYAAKVFKLCQAKAVNLESLDGLVSYFFTENYPYDDAAKERVFKKGEAVSRMKDSLDMLSNIDEANFTSTVLHDEFEKLASLKNLKITEFFPPLRFALSGLAGGPDLLPMVEVLGKTKTLERLTKSIALFA